MKFKKKVNRIIAGAVAAAMTMTMIPEVWLPVYADSVRNEIVNADTDSMGKLTAADEDIKTVSGNTYVPAIQQNEKICEYTVFSGSNAEDFTLNGWKADFTGGIYTGRNFVCNLSEFYLDGKTDAAGSVTANGWKVNIPEKNENIGIIPMPDLEEAILEKAGVYTYFSESPSFIQDTNIINGSIMVSGDVIISGTNFEGDCYIIADRDITYNVNDLRTTGRLVLYSRNGNITVNGTNINIDGIMYAPKGKVSFNANETTVNGRVWADTINLSGSVFNIKGSESDLDLIGSISKKDIGKTYTINEDFNEGSFNGLSLAVPDQLTLAENTAGEKLPVEKVYGDTQSGNGVKLTYSSDTSTVSQTNQTVNISYSLSGFGEIQNSSNSVDLVIAVDESGSMSGSRMTNAKAAVKEAVSQMKPGDRCALVGFNYNARVIQELTYDKSEMNAAVDKLRLAYDNNIHNGLKKSMELFDDNSRQRYIMLISDGEDDSASAAIAKEAGEKGIRIFALMIGTGSLQMQTVAINSNGIYKNAPTAADIGKIMSYFASEVFSTAGRNAAFKTTINDKNSVDLNAITPAPAAVTENIDGSVTLEWSFDRISVDESEKINIPVKAVDPVGFADLMTDTSCVYYDKNGKPHIIYAEDVSLPVSKYVSGGKWSAVYDSEKSGTEWKSIYWNGRRCGDGRINVTACASEDGVTFGEAVPVENYGEINGLSGRYVKLCVNMTLSSDGGSPELYDITVSAAQAEKIENRQPSADIYTKHNVKVNIPVTVRGIVSDDCLASGLAFKWSCNDSNVTFADNNALITSAVFAAEGGYTIKLTVNDGEKTAEAVFDITVSPADTYADIDPEAGKAKAPEISVNLPRYADRGQKITAKIENLNGVEISWYSVIFNENKTIEVSDSSEYTLTMPYINGDYKVIVRAFDWAGQSDVKEYTITVSTEEPTIEIIPSSENVSEGDEAYFTVNTTLSDKIKSVGYTLNGENVTVSDGKYILDTSKAGVYTFAASAVTTKGKTLTSSAIITVKKHSVPSVDLMFDKENYAEGDNVTVTVIAEDEIGIGGIALEYDGKQVALDENNSYTVENITAGIHTIVGIAWNTDGVVSSAGYSIDIPAAADNIVPELTVSCDRYEIFAGETLPVYIEASDNSGEVFVTVTVNGESVPYDGSGVFYFTGEEYGIYEIMVYAEDAAGNRRWDGVDIGVNAQNQDVSAPAVEIIPDKDSYYAGDDIAVTVKASDNVGVTKTVVTVNGSEVTPDVNGRYVIQNAAVGIYEIKATAYDAAGNSSWKSASVPVKERGSVSADELSLDVFVDTEKVEIGKASDIVITVNGGVGEKTVSCIVNGSSVSVNNSKAVFTPDKAGKYVIAVSAVDEAGNNIAKTLTLTVTENGAHDGNTDIDTSLEDDKDYVDRYQRSLSAREIIDVNINSEVGMTAEMAEMVDRLGTPAAVYEYLYNNINCEFYTGSRKGAIGTYEQNGGNDVDCASLLIACLRYMGYRADYATGTISIDIEQAKQLTCTDDSKTALNILGYAGRTGFVSDKTVDFDHTWVTAEIDGHSYDLDISFKKYRKVESLREKSDYQKNDVLNTNIKKFDDRSDFYWFIKKYRNSDLSESINVVGKTIVKKKYDVLPLTLPYNHDIIKEQISDIRLSEYVKSDYMTVGFGAENYKIYSSDLSVNSVTVGFENSYGSYAYPVLYIDNVPVKKWDSSLSQRGSHINMSISLFTSGYNYTYNKEILTGSSHAIVTDSQNISPQEILTAYQKMPLSETEKAAVSADNVFDDKYIGNLLNIIGKTYFFQLDIESQILANAGGVYQERYLSVGIFSYDPCFNERFGMINELSEGTFSVDIIGNNTAAVSLENDSESEMNYYFSSGYVSSYLEHLVLEQFTGIDSVSTAKIFSVAKHQGINIKYICSANASDIDHLNLDPSDLAEIRAAVNAGSIVIVPERNIRINDWVGTGYIVQNDKNHEIAFRLSSGISGGSTTSTAPVDMVIKTVITFEELYSILYGLVSLGAAMLCTGNALGAVFAGATFVAALVLSFRALEAYYQATKLYYLALSGNSDAEELLHETVKLEVLLEVIGLSEEFIIEPIGGSLFGASLGKAADEVDGDIIASGERLKEFLYDELDELSEEMLYEISGDPNFLLYDDEVIEEIVKNENADVVIDVIHDCSYDVVIAMNEADDKSAAVQLIVQNGAEGAKQLARDYISSQEINDGYKRIEKIEVNFNYNVKYDKKEFERQLSEQEKGMNQLTVQEYLTNRQEYINNGRAIESKMYQAKAREEAYYKKLFELKQENISDDEAKKQAYEWLESQAALHNPDMIAGGNPENVGGMGDKKVNSSIGSQWRYRIDDVDKAIRELADKMTDEEKSSTYLNISLTFS